MQHDDKLIWEAHTKTPNEQPLGEAQNTPAEFWFEDVNINVKLLALKDESEAADISRSIAEDDDITEGDKNAVMIFKRADKWFCAVDQEVFPRIEDDLEYAMSLDNQVQF